MYCLAFITFFSPAPTIVVYTDVPNPATYLAAFTENGYQIQFRPVGPAYRSDQAIVLLDQVAQEPVKSQVLTLLLLKRRITYPAHGNPFYHIKGLSYLGRPIAVVSVGKSTVNQIRRTIIHEFGHTKALQHCPHLNCIMNDAKGSLANVANCREFKGTCQETMRSWFPIRPVIR
jgi:hypothetical protein